MKIAKKNNDEIGKSIRTLVLGSLRTTDTFGYRETRTLENKVEVLQEMLADVIAHLSEQNLLPDALVLTITGKGDHEISVQDDSEFAL